ncbi:MAG: adenosylcobinamide-phosphate synthase CbiB [Eubacteriaceae bacterium]
MKLLLIAFILDLIFGDPYWLPHPIKLIGTFINYMEKNIRKIAKSDLSLKIYGVILLCITVVFSVLIVYVPLELLKKFGPIYYNIGFVYFSYTVLSTKCLANEAKKVMQALAVSLDEGRRRVAYIVGRDTKELQEQEVIKATIETVAENTTDGIIAPLIFLFIGGPVLAMAFKAVSTLDSMVGYQNEKYRDLGWASAKTDDILNYIPARISGFIMVIAAFILRYDYANSYSILLRDHDKHKSPNSAWTEAAAAGALNIQLGGSHEYFGKTVYKPSIGENLRTVEINDILKMNKLMITTSIIFISFIYLCFSILIENLLVG